MWRQRVTYLKIYLSPTITLWWHLKLGCRKTIRWWQVAQIVTRIRKKLWYQRTLFKQTNSKLRNNTILMDCRQRLIILMGKGPFLTWDVRSIFLHLISHQLGFPGSTIIIKIGPFSNLKERRSFQWFHKMIQKKKERYGFSWRMMMRTKSKAEMKMDFRFLRYNFEIIKLKIKYIF